MGRPKLTEAERKIRSLQADREIMQRELRAVGDMKSEWAQELAAEYRLNIARIDSAIENVETNGLPPGYSEKWGDNA